MTGAIIGLSVGEPLLALPAAFLSHFVCDALPHFGVDRPNYVWLRSNAFKRMLVVDAFLCIVLVVILLLTRPHHWLLACFCAFLATSPDLVWINHFRLAQANKPWHPNLFSRFAAIIQWFEHPIGMVVEGTWFISGILILSIYIHH